jgi:hypothetical protein
MFEKKYKRKALSVKAVRFDGTQEMAEDLSCEYLDISYDGMTLWFEPKDFGIQEGEWLLFKDQRVIDVLSNTEFNEQYEEDNPYYDI